MYHSENEHNSETRVRTHYGVPIHNISHSSTICQIKSNVNKSVRHVVTLQSLAQSVGAIEYIDNFSASGLDPIHNEGSRYDTKQSDGEVPVMLELWRMQSTSSLPLLPSPLWSGVVAVGWLVGFNGISISIGYLMPKPVCTNVRFVNT